MRFIISMSTLEKWNNQQTWIGATLLLLAGLSTLFMLKNNGNLSPYEQALLKRQYDAFMVNVTYYEYGKNGSLQSWIKAPKVYHYPIENSAKFYYPKMMIYTDDHIPWYINSDHGKSRNGTEWVYLWQNVVIHQPQYPRFPETTINTDNLTVHPAESRAETQSFVTIIQPGSQITGTGMNVNFKTGTAQLMKESEGFYNDYINR